MLVVWCLIVGVRRCSWLLFLFAICCLSFVVCCLLPIGCSVFIACLSFVVCYVVCIVCFLCSVRVGGRCELFVLCCLHVC